mmetsp:Transcript_32243/g.47652  ORF Transcript_32243/g.47652 Transcript_32243/m.47652 type:complete len:228 (-) Transcript_32243:1495-2178(-)
MVPAVWSASFWNWVVSWVPFPIVTIFRHSSVKPASVHQSERRLLHPSSQFLPSRENQHHLAMTTKTFWHRFPQWHQSLPFLRWRPPRPDPPYRPLWIPHRNRRRIQHHFPHPIRLLTQRHCRHPIQRPIRLRCHPRHPRNRRELLRIPENSRIFPRTSFSCTLPSIPRRDQRAVLRPVLRRPVLPRWLPPRHRLRNLPPVPRRPNQPFRSSPLRRRAFGWIWKIPVI